MIAAVLYCFGFGVVALLIRFSENACWRCANSCGKCLRMCGRFVCKFLLCIIGCGRCNIYERCERGCGAIFKPVCWVLSHVKLRWYWLLLANNIAFMLREYTVISLLDGWYPEVLIANVSIWLSLLIVLWEVWRFSAVRVLAPRTVDMVLDMILLPLNYGMFCALCTRILKLQNSNANREMVTALIDSADIWESWALWSVLELFVLVVDKKAETHTQNMTTSWKQEYMENIKTMKVLSVQGVKAFFLILFCFISVDILVKGVIASYAPTFCYWLYKDCMSCDEWYGLRINPVAQSIIYIMCTFALIFVFTFERMYSEHLHCIQPYWKFWGVKIVVSVTYFQWLIINYCFGLPTNKIYLFHCLVCCIEMPLLALLHARFAYPCPHSSVDEHWLITLLELSSCSRSAAVDEDVGTSNDEDVMASSTAEEMSEAHSATIPEPSHGTEAEAPLARSPTARASSQVARPAGEMASQISGHLSCPSLPSCLLYIIIWLSCCYGAYRVLFAVVRPELDIHAVKPVYNFTCNEKELGHFVEEMHSDCHWVLPEDRGQIRIPNTAGVWLPLCGSATLECAVGFQGNPSISCSPSGRYEWVNSCQQVSCGPPIGIQNATPQYDHSAWTSGMKVKYKCDKGYKGSPVATCEASGNYSIVGTCEEIVCGQPLHVDHAIIDNPLRKWKEGMQVFYQCKAGYYGSPLGKCGSDERWIVQGICTVKCVTLPVVKNAQPNLESNATYEWAVGARLRYKCDSGYGGKLVAVCTEDGKFRVEGSCEVVCGNPLRIPHAEARIDVDQAKRGWRPGSVLSYWCDAGYGGSPQAWCGFDGQWNFTDHANCNYLGCGPLETFMSNKSASWANRMVVKEKINFTSSDDGDIVFFACRVGYSGRPMATCIKGEWSLQGECTIECGLPPEISHAEPRFNLSELNIGWLVGMRVLYKCDVGYGGGPMATCSTSGKWTFDGANQCVDLGCGSVKKFLSDASQSWQEEMHITDMINFTESEYGDVVMFQCQPGYTGRPVATCDKGRWQLTERCSLYKTSLRCSCRKDWTHCKEWLGSNCQAWHGCTVSSLGDSYRWCEVEVGSCPEGISTPSWDYCASESDEIHWEPQQVPDIGPPTSIKVLLPMLVVAVIVLLGFLCFRFAKARRWRLPGNAATEMQAPEASPSLGDVAPADP